MVTKTKLTSELVSANRITAQDVAKLAQVSVGTVSRVFNNAPNVDEKNRRQVLEAANNLGYIHIAKKRHAPITAESSRLALKSIVFGLRDLEPHWSAKSSVPLMDEDIYDLGRTYYALMLHGAVSEAATHGINVTNALIKDTPEGIASLKTLLDRNQMDGLLLVDFKSRELIEQVLKLEVPVVSIDNFWEDLPVEAVTVDSIEGTKKAVNHLIELGHRDIVFVCGNRYDYSARQRLNGYRLSLIEAGIPYRPELIFQGNMTILGGELVAEQILESNVKHTAICCSNDAEAIGVIRSLTRIGKRVGQEISVTGFDNLDNARLISPALTTIHASIEGLGSIAVQNLVERALNPRRPIVHTMLPSQLIIRESTGPVSPIQPA